MRFLVAFTKLIGIGLFVFSVFGLFIPVGLPSKAIWVLGSLALGWFLFKFVLGYLKQKYNIVPTANTGQQKEIEKGVGFIGLSFLVLFIGIIIWIVTAIGGGDSGKDYWDTSQVIVFITVAIFLVIIYLGAKKVIKK